MLLVLFISCRNTRINRQLTGDDLSKASDRVFLDSLQHRTFLYFWDEANPNNGLIRDRAPTPSFSSIAATGFGLTADVIGVSRGYVSREQSAKRVLTTLKFFWTAPQGSSAVGMTGYKGFFYHFLDMDTGERYQKVELSTIDTTWLLAGILSCQSFFDGNTPVEQQIRALADSIYDRVNWQWALNNKNAVSMGWHPESGFLSAQWKGYNEGMMLVILGLGSPTHPLDSTAWKTWTSTYDWGSYYGYSMVQFGPLFGHQYSQMYIDFRKIQDAYMRNKGIDYFENSRLATMAQQAYGKANPYHFTGYSGQVWGLTACDGPGNQSENVGDTTIQFMGYSARGAAANYHVDDGTIAPTAAGGSIPFAPDICIAALRSMYNKYGSQLWGKYGFKDAFNPTFTFNGNGPMGWVDKDYIGIDQGPIEIMIQNYRNGMVWNLMKKNPYIINGLKKAGFTGGWLSGK